MTIQTTFGSTAWPPPLFTGNQTQQLTSRSTAFSAGTVFTTILRAPKTGNISGVEFWCGGNTTGTFNPYTVGIQSVDATGNHPSGAYLAGGNGKATFTPVASTWMVTTFVGNVSVTRGDLIAVTWTPPASNIGTFSLTCVQSQNYGRPGDLYYNGSSWAYPAPSGVNSFALRYSDGSYGYNPGVMPYTNSTQINMTTATSPAQAGMKFTLPFPVSVKGCYVNVEASNTAGPYEVVLYDSTGNYSSILTKVIVGTYESKGYYQTLTFPSTITLTANVPYRLVMRPTTTSSIKLTKNNTNSTALTAAVKGAPNVYWTQCSISNPIDNSTWTDVTTACPLNMGLFLNGFSDGNSGSSLGVTIPLITFLG